MCQLLDEEEKVSIVRLGLGSPSVVGCWVRVRVKVIAGWGRRMVKLVHWCWWMMDPLCSTEQAAGKPA